MKRVILLLVVLFIGIWMGINFMRGAPLFSNPFEDGEVVEKLKTETRELAEDAEEKIKEAITPK